MRSVSNIGAGASTLDEEVLITTCFEKYDILGQSLAFYQYVKDPANADQISGFTALPGINNKMSQGLLDGIYWVPQMVCRC